MRTKLIIGIAAAAILALGVSSLGIADRDGERSVTNARGKGKLVAKDSAKRYPAASVARVTLKDFGKVSYKIVTKPNRLKVDWNYIVRCEKGFLFDYYPGPGQATTKTAKTPIRGTFKNIPLKDPNSCTFSVGGQIQNGKGGKRIISKLYDKG